ncbi:MAG: cytochrome C oxidase subunit IV family protein [Phycisphaeraceae bacterium]|nr:cytochrome C oxidase subunit IV family protein [Phycisphaeraceae bacterium]
MGHVAPLRALIGTGAALLVLTWLTVAVTRVDLGELNIFVALGVATVKAGLVMLFFMHLRWDRPFNAIVCIGSIAFVALMIAFTILDTAEYQDTINPGDAKAVRETIESLGN